MLRNMSNQAITVEDWRIVVDVLRSNADLGIAGQRRLERVRFVVGKDIEVPHGSAAWLVAVKWPGEADLSGVLVDDERSVVGKLAGQAVANVRITIYVGIGRSHLCANSWDLRLVTGKT